MLHDIDLLVETIPGCKSMTPDDAGVYTVAVSSGLAAISGDPADEPLVMGVATAKPCGNDCISCHKLASAHSFAELTNFKVGTATFAR